MTNITPRSDERWEGGFVRDQTTGEITVKVTQGNVALSTSDIEVGAVEIKNATTDDRVTVSAAGALKVDASSVAVPVTGPLTDTQLRASAVPVSGTITASGPLTDTQLRASAVPVSGTVAISTALALDATLTGGTQKAIARGGAKGATTAADTTSTAEGADHQGLDVQVYHGGVAVNPATIRALTSADVVTAAQGTAAAAANAWTAKVTDGTNTAAVKAASTAAVATDPSLVVAVHPTSPLPAGASKIGTVDIATAPAVAKGTQGANGVPTQDLKDSGRAAITISGFQVAGIITTEALFAASLVRAADGVAAGAAAQHTVTAGKRLRIQSIAVTVKNTAAAAGTSKLALRYRPGGGTVAITDSVIAILDIGSNNATANNYIGPYLMDVPDGFELVGSATFGFTNLSSATSMLHTITVIGFEY